LYDPRRSRPRRRPGRFPFQLSDRLAIVVLQPVPDVVIVGVFFDGQLVRMTEELVGEA
jgi:hypothetical protein